MFFLLHIECVLIDGNVGISEELVAPSQLGLEFVSDKPNIKQMRIAPYNRHYVVEIIYSFVVNGRPLKALNQFYSKRKGKM